MSYFLIIKINYLVLGDLSIGIFIFLIEGENSRYFRISLWGSLVFDLRDIFKNVAQKINIYV